MEPHLLQAFIEHAKAAYPNECCGLLINTGSKTVYFACRNQSENPQDDFVIPAEDYATAESAGEVIAVCHSHPDATSKPSDRDIAMCEATEMPWHILSWPEGDLRTITPTGEIPPLIGRRFVHGIIDCYALVRDWFRINRNITLPDFERQDGWWEGEEELYLNNFRKAGFQPVTDGSLNIGDGILMQVQSQRVNHAAVYIGNGRIIHHLYGKLSCEGIYGGYWQERTRIIVRHKTAI